MSDYNGWKNWETWNVALWCDNDEFIYRNRMRLKPRTEQEVEDFVREYFPAGTPDMQDMETDAFYKDEIRVDWQEIAEHWASDYEEEKS